MPSLETPPNPAPTPEVQPPAPSSQPLKFTTRRFGEIEEHELLHLLDSIDDEISRARFRESIYVSVIICLAIAWLAAYGPRVLWHGGQLAPPPEQVTKLDRQIPPFIELPKNLVHKPPPKPANISDQDRVAQNAHKVPQVQPPPKPLAGPPAPLPPAPQPQPRPPAPQPQQQAQVQPPAPRPQPQPRPTPNNSIPDAPRPAVSQSQRPSFATSNESAGQSIRDAANAAAHSAGGGSGNYGSAPTAAHNGANTGVDILSNTLGVDFAPYIRRILRMIYNQWVPLIPEETRPPLNKEGWTLIRFTINSNGTVSAMHLDASTRDSAIDRAAWGGITGVGQFPPLPKEFTGPNLELRIHFEISRNPAKNDF